MSAAIAAIVSYSHIYDLGRAHGGTGVPARLLPLSVDMLILVGELMLLHEADTKGRRFVLGWVLVWSGILATLAANVAFGAQFGIAGALIWGWPAYSFVLAAWGMVAVVKRSAATPVPEIVAGVMPDVTTEIAPEAAPEAMPEVITETPGWDAFRSEPVVSREDMPPGALPVATEEPPVVIPEPVPVATGDIAPEITPPLPARRRRVVPAKASDDELVAIILDATDDPGSLTNYKVNKAIKAACGDKGVGETRATRLVDLAQRRHRSRSVVAIGDRR